MTDKILIAPSILSADYSRLGEEVRDVLDAGADWIHFDVMDGMFVSNITIGPPVLEALSSRIRATYDVHLMIEKPWRYAQQFVISGAQYVSVHVEAGTTAQIADTLRIVRDNGAKCGIVLKPGTFAEAAEPFLELIDLIMVMTVEPGFGGQSFHMDMLPKIRELRRLIEERNPSCLLEVDGGVNEKTSKLCIEAGANVLVAGNAVFNRSERAAIIEALRES